SSLLLHRSPSHRDLHSFPTRRSSDLSFQGRTQTWLPAIRYCPGAQEEYTVQGDSFGTWYAFHPAGAGVRRAPFLPISQVFRAVSTRGLRVFLFSTKSPGSGMGQSTEGVTFVHWKLAVHR